MMITLPIHSAQRVLNGLMRVRQRSPSLKYQLWESNLCQAQHTDLSPQSYGLKNMVELCCTGLFYIFRCW